ncbi:aminotransferase class I/II-fold pyridoxal phosphate-dependent enzyme [Massilia sp. Dwa41.01b]|nr:aminotransferase class I/II-fold pyridoxal phosphate-dependent enzyme [Massilia sp. Dwa41.01b]
MHEETLVFERDDDIAELGACGALRGSVAQFAQPRGADLMRRTEALDAWCQLRTRHGVWQYARAVDGAPAPEASVCEEGGILPATHGINFASQDYLSLASHPTVRAAAMAALDESGPHSAGSAVLLGNSRHSLALEEALGALLRQEHVTLFPTGWGAAFGVITALVNGRDYVVIDQLAHASLRQGAAAATRNVLLHRHLDTGHVRELLAAIRARDPENGILVVTEGLFSMDADAPDLPLMQHLCREYGATLLVDVAHDPGALGPGGSGCVGEQSMLGKVDIVMGAFSKTFASNGGFVASASRAVKRQLQLFAGPHLFSNALSPLQAASVLAALRIVTGAEGDTLRAAMLRNALALRAHLAETGMRCLGIPSAIVPLWIGSESVARLAGRTLARSGVFVNAVEFPGVPLGAARLRLQVMAAHTPEQLRHGARLIGASVGGAGAALGVEPSRQPWRGSVHVAESGEPHSRTLPGQLRLHAARTPQRVAYSFLRESGEVEDISYAGLTARVDAFAARLAHRVQPGEPVLLLYPSGIDFVVAFLACLPACRRGGGAGGAGASAARWRAPGGAAGGRRACTGVMRARTRASDGCRARTRPLCDAAAARRSLRRPGDASHVCGMCGRCRLPPVHLRLHRTAEGRRDHPREYRCQRARDRQRFRLRTGDRDGQLAAAVSRHGLDRQRVRAADAGLSFDTDGARRLPAPPRGLAGGDHALSRYLQRCAELRVGPVCAPGGRGVQARPGPIQPGGTL